jgi:HEAT repeat protein
MDKTIRSHLDNIRSSDRNAQNKAYMYILEQTDQPVDWAYEAWDEMLEGLTHKDNHVRANSAQVLCNLVKSDPKNRMLKDFEKLLAVTKDKDSSPQDTVCRRYGRLVLREKSKAGIHGWS